MKKYANGFITVVLISVFVFASGVNLFATETRVSSMGGVGFFMKDNSNIFYYPGTINQYSGQVIGELRFKENASSYTIGVNYPINDNSVFGMYLNRPMAIGVPYGVVQEVVLDHTTDFYYGMKSATFDLGFRLSAALDSYKDRDTVTKESAHYFAFGAGLSSEKTDIGLLAEMPGVNHKEPGNYEDKWSGFNFGAGARTFLGENTKIVPVVNFLMGSSKAEYDSTSANNDVEYTNMDLGLGVGLNHPINEDNLLILGLELFGMSSRKSEIDSSTTTTTVTTTMPGLYMGLESRINSWLTGRVGAAQVFQTVKTKTKPFGGTEVENSGYNSNYDLYFGVGINFSNFTLDAAINEGLFFDGPNFISGTTNAIANRLSLTYKF
jgi:hypothetical protein